MMILLCGNTITYSDRNLTYDNKKHNIYSLHDITTTDKDIIFTDNVITISNKDITPKEIIITSSNNVTDSDIDL